MIIRPYERVHDRGVVSLTKPALPASHWEGVSLSAGEMDSLHRTHVKTVFLTPNRPITPQKQGEHKAPTPLNFVDKAPTFGTPNHTLYIQQ